MPVKPLLLDLLEGIPSGTDDERPLREAAEELARRFEQARQMYEQGEYRPAAEAFLTAACGARGHDALATLRAAAYRNAARSWYMAGVLPEKRAQLEAAAREDPGCAQDIERMLEILGP